MIVHRLTLRMQPQPVRQSVCLSQGDSDFRLYLQLTAGDGGTFALEENTTGKLVCRKPDGSPLELATGTPSLGTLAGEGDVPEYPAVNVSGSAALTDAPGRGTCKLCLTHSGKELYSESFNIIIEASPGGGI